MYHFMGRHGNTRKTKFVVLKKSVSLRQSPSPAVINYVAHALSLIGRGKAKPDQGPHLFVE